LGNFERHWVNRHVSAKFIHDGACQRVWDQWSQNLVSFFIYVERFVDPHLGWDRSWFWWLADEAFGTDAIGGGENGLASFENECG
jgi:hypothetical protein